ncbi:MAG: YggS family pyridoxal phosphate-dependent enzyme [Phycisphaerae bacterium]|nr:YggS family pyridoxal phosphate-dependent enzyme [Phycisphaerae bacterium]
MPITPENLAASVAGVQARIAEAARRSGRDPAAVRLIAVTKYVDLDAIRSLLAIGLRDFGESRVQQLTERAAELEAARRRWDELPGQRWELLPPIQTEEEYTEISAGRRTYPEAPLDVRPNWHFIGNLQRNKVRAALGVTTILHAVDSIRLAEAISRVAIELNTGVDVFLELNIAGEASKHGVSPAEADAVAEAISGLQAVRLRGLMTMAPAADAGDAARPHFARLRELRDRWLKAGVVSKSCTELSMGMSGDFEAAILEGSTCVRLGSVLYGSAAAVQNPVQNPPA